MHVTRLTYDLLRPVPMTPLEIRTEVVRPSRRISVVEARLFADDVARDAGRRPPHRRAGDLDLPDGVVPDDPPPGEPGAGEEAIPLGGGNAYNDIGVEIRFVEGGFQHPGPGWRGSGCGVPVVAGEEPTPLQRAAAAADLGNGLSSVLRQRDWLYINPDLSVHVARPPAGEWIGLRARHLPVRLRHRPGGERPLRRHRPLRPRRPSPAHRPAAPRRLSCWTPGRGIRPTSQRQRVRPTSSRPPRS